MGVYLSKANTEKESDYGGDGAKTNTIFGLTSMQGWRQSMEDAHLALTDVEIVRQALGRSCAIYGVFDGHGGAAVSAWIAKHLVPVLGKQLDVAKGQLESESYSTMVEGCEDVPKDILILCEALQQCFLQLDVEMQSRENSEELRRIYEEKSDQEIQDSGTEDGPPSLRLLGSQPRQFLQAFLSGPKPVIKLVEQNGEQYFQISPANDNEATASSTEADQSSEQPHPPESIVEDPTVTAPDTRNPAVVSSTAASSEKEGAEHPPPPPPSSQAAEEQEADQPSSQNPEMADSPSLQNVRAESMDQPNLLANDSELMRSTGSVADSCGAAVVVAAVLEGDPPYLITANAGDSRCVLCRASVALAQSYDHKPQLDAERDRIYRAGGCVSNGRVDGNLNLSRTLGDLFYKRNKALKPEEQKITAYPDVRIMPITPEDEFVILACDGIWDCITNQQACEFVRARLGDDPTPEHLSKICEEICDFCLAENPIDSDGGIGCDNMTCIIVLLNQQFTQRGAVGSATSRLYERKR